MDSSQQPDAGDKTRRRATARFRTSIHAELTADGESRECQVVNLSRSGVLLEGALPPLRRGARVECTLHAPVGKLQLDTGGTVARALDGEDGQVRLGIDFGDLTPSQRDTLEALISRVLEGHTAVPLDDLPTNATEREIREALEKIPLPHRIALAARGNPRERVFLKHDTHAQVLEALARNPNLITPEALDLAVSRHLTVRIIELMSDDARWKNNEQLRVILATHPRVPAMRAEQLLEGLGAPALRRALGRSGLSDLVRDKILRKLRGR